MLEDAVLCVALTALISAVLFLYFQSTLEDLGAIDGWDHFVGYMTGSLDIHKRLIICNREDLTVRLSATDIAMSTLSEATLKLAEKTVRDYGLVILTGGLFKSDDLKAADDLIYSELERHKVAAYARGMDRNPWNMREWYTNHETDLELEYEQKQDEYMNAGVYTADEIDNLLGKDPNLFPKDNYDFADSVSITYGRIDMPHMYCEDNCNNDMPILLNEPFWNRADFNWLTSRLHGAGGSREIMVGALWNFPGSNQYLWHEDRSAAEDEVDGTLTWLIQTRDLSPKAGPLYFQPGTNTDSPFGCVHFDCTELVRVAYDFLYRSIFVCASTFCATWPRCTVCV